MGNKELHYLDGSSKVETNGNPGTIVGIYEKGPNNSLKGRTGRESIVAAFYIVYGSQISLVFASKKTGVHEFRLNEEGKFVWTRQIQIPERTEAGVRIGAGGYRRDWIDKRDNDFVT